MTITIEKAWKWTAIISLLILMVIYMTGCAYTSTKGKKTEYGGYSFSQTQRTSVGGKLIKPENTGSFTMTTTEYPDGKIVTVVDLKSGVKSESSVGGDPAGIITSLTGLAKELKTPGIPSLPTTETTSLPLTPEEIRKMIEDALTGANPPE